MERMNWEFEKQCYFTFGVKGLQVKENIIEKPRNSWERDWESERECVFCVCVWERECVREREGESERMSFSISFPIKAFQQQ